LVLGLGVHKVILTDINMPEIDGLQLAKIIKRNLLRLKSGEDQSFSNFGSPTLAVPLNQHHHYMHKAELKS